MVSRISDEKRQTGAFIQYVDNRMELASLLYKVKKLRKLIKKYEVENGQHNNKE